MLKSPFLLLYGHFVCCPRAKWQAKSYLSLHKWPQTLHWKGRPKPWQPMWTVNRMLSVKWTSQWWHLWNSCCSVAGEFGWLSLFMLFSKLMPGVGLQFRDMGDSLFGEVWTELEHIAPEICWIRIGFSSSGVWESGVRSETCPAKVESWSKGLLKDKPLQTGLWLSFSSDFERFLNSWWGSLWEKSWT